MSQEERFDTRDRTYSKWHRRMSTGRFVGIETAQTLAMIDLDASLYVEYDDKSKEPLALIETAIDRGQNYKCATVTKNLARRCAPVVPALILLYKISDSMNPHGDGAFDIEEFRVRKIWPEPETSWKIFTPQEWAEWLVRLRKWSAAKLDIELFGSAA